MTDTATAAAAAASTPTARRLPSMPTLFGIGVALGGLVIFAANYNVYKGENGGLGPAIVTAIILVTVAALLYFVVVPRVQNVSRSVVILSAVAIVTMLAFWAGATPLVAAAALGVGTRAAQLSKAARILQPIAVVAAAVTLVVTLAQSSLF
jgi:hypothetical protein